MFISSCFGLQCYSSKFSVYCILLKVYCALDHWVVCSETCRFRVVGSALPRVVRLGISQWEQSTLFLLGLMLPSQNHQTFEVGPRFSAVSAAELPEPCAQGVRWHVEVVTLISSSKSGKCWLRIFPRCVQMWCRDARWIGLVRQLGKCFDLCT